MSSVIDHSSLILHYYESMIYLDREQVFEDALKKRSPSRHEAWRVQA